MSPKTKNAKINSHEKKLFYCTGRYLYYLCHTSKNEGGESEPTIVFSVVCIGVRVLDKRENLLIIRDNFC